MPFARSKGKSMSKIYLIRHGEVESNRKSAYVGSTDLALNDHGQHQAELAAEYLADKHISVVYASDLKRAYKTAEIIARRLGLTVTAVPELRELDYGDWEGAAEAEVPKLYGDVFLEWRKNPVDVRIPGGETVGELRDRAYPAFCRIVDQHSDDNLVIVAHKTTNRTLLCCLLGVDPNNYRQIGQGNAAMNVIERRNDGRLVVDQINEGCHLLGTEEIREDGTA